MTTPTEADKRAADKINQIMLDNEMWGWREDIERIIVEAMTEERTGAVKFLRNLASNLDLPESRSREQLIWTINTVRLALNEQITAIEKVTG